MIKKVYLFLGIIGLILILSIDFYKNQFLSILNTQINYSPKPFHILLQAEHFFDKAYLSKKKEYLLMAEGYLSSFDSNLSKKAIALIHKILKNNDFSKENYEKFYKIIRTILIRDYQQRIIHKQNLEKLKNTIYSNAIYFEMLIFFIVSALIILYVLFEKFKEIKHKSYLDPLTGAYSRKKFYEIHQYLPHETNTIILADIDHFKKINDTYGHKKGDEVLKDFVRIVKNHIRKEDLIIRWGGEEFLIILNNTPKNIGVEVAKKLREEIEKHNFNGLKVTTSFGVKECHKHQIKEEDIIAVDNALYKAKEKRNEVVLY